MQDMILPLSSVEIILRVQLEAWVGWVSGGGARGGGGGGSQLRGASELGT